jgi:hypothetical protein
MQTDCRAVIVALFLVLLVGTASLLSQASTSLYSQFEVLAAMPVSGWVDTTGWHSYENEQYGFQIKYPDDFIPTEHAYELVTSGAVVTFVPTFDPSIDTTGAKTNLYDFSVTIGVTDVSTSLSGQDAFCYLYAHERRLNGQRELSRVHFARYYFSEGAVGNRYEKLSYRAACGDTCYEITLFVHYGSPYCYSPGAIKTFDPTEILHLFDTMAGTFWTPTEDCYSNEAVLDFGTGSGHERGQTLDLAYSVLSVLQSEP